ncbi:hypothetical protein BDV18DRAFT_152392 [Aspergillus unguis]
MFVTSAAAFAFANVNPTNYIGGVSFLPERDIPDLSGKIILESIRQILQHNPEHVFLAARSEGKAKDAIADLEAAAPNKKSKLTWLPLDLSSTKSVQDAAESFKNQASRLDVLLLNAGVMSLPPGETDLGHEIQLGTNHTGHFLLANLLLPVLLKTAEEPGSDVRVVSLSSVGHNLAPGFESILDQDKLKKCNTHSRYGASKAANILFAAELARRHPSLTAVSVHPGVIATDLYGAVQEGNPLAGLGVKFLGSIGTKVDQGAWNQLWAAVGAKKEQLINGAYYVPVGNGKPHNQYVTSKEMGQRLWEWSEAELKKGGKENFFDRVLQRPASQGAEVARRASDASDKERPEGLQLERPASHGETEIKGSGPQTLRRQRRSSRLQRLKDYMHSEQEYDEVGDMYARLM